MELKLKTAYDTIELNNLHIKESDQKLNQMRLNGEAERARIKCLESEKNHLEILNRENIGFKDRYKAKCEELETLNINLKRETSVFKKDIVAIDELKRDRDVRLKELRDEIE